MSKNDLFQLLIALWGAILSTGLALIKYLESRKKISIRFTHIVWYESQEFTITNSGKIPITVKDVGVKLKYVGNFQDPYRLSPAEPVEAENLLPCKIDEGGSITFTFQLDFEQLIIKDSFVCIVKDTNGKIYTSKKLYVFDGKYRYDMKVKRHPKSELKEYWESKEKES